MPGDESTHAAGAQHQYFLVAARCETARQFDEIVAGQGERRHHRSPLWRYQQRREPAGHVLVQRRVEAPGQRCRQLGAKTGGSWVTEPQPATMSRATDERKEPRMERAKCKSGAEQTIRKKRGLGSH